MFLSLACDNKRMDFFFKLASSKHSNVKKFSKYILISHEDGKKTLLFPNMNYESLSVSKFIEIYNAIKGKAEKVVILCHSYDKDVKAFATHFDTYFLIFDRFETYEKLYKYYQIFPEIKETFKSSKMLTFKDFVAFSFNKKKSERISSFRFSTRLFCNLCQNDNLLHNRCYTFGCLCNYFSI